MFSGFFVSWLSSRVGGGVFFAGQRWSGGGDISSSRFDIWWNCFNLLHDSPFSGVGWGELNWAWTMEVLSSRVMTLVNHAHNIHYQWALEMGWPVAIFLSCVLGVLIFRGARAIFSANNSGGDVLMLQGTVLSCLVLILHSELEYPLWYVYFLLPFSYWLGLLLLVSSSEGVGQGHGVLTAAGLRAGGVVAMFVLVYALFDYSRIVRIYAPSRGALYVSMERRISEGRKGWFFGVYGDLAYVFTRDPVGVELSVFDRPMHHLVNPLLLKSYAIALRAHGRDTEADFMVARLMEFHSPVVDKFFSVCSALEKGASAPFQCR